MAHFFVESKGSSGIVSRCGTKESGVWCSIRGWKSGVVIEGHYDSDLEKDVFTIYMTDGSDGYGKKEIGFITVRKNPDNINPETNVVVYHNELDYYKKEEENGNQIGY